jgi:AcrR family transcriptional regulator
MNKPNTRAKTDKPETANPYAARDLTREMIVEAAMRLLRELGVEKLSMRRLAAELDVTATALYYHVGSKDELLDAVITRLLRSAASVGESLPWQEALEELVVQLQYLGSEYPGVPRHLAEHLESEATLLWMELLLRVIKRAGFSDEQASAAFIVVGFYNSAQPLRGDAPLRSAPWDVLHPDAIAARVAHRPEAFPTLARMVSHVRQPDETLFRLGLRSLIAGLVKQFGESSAQTEQAGGS